MSIIIAVVCFVVGVFVGYECMGDGGWHEGYRAGYEDGCKDDDEVERVP